MNYHQKSDFDDGKDPDDLNHPRFANHQSSHINSEMSLESIKEKIDFGWLSFFGSLIFGAVFCILNRAGDVYLAVQLYCCSNVSLYYSTVPIVTCNNNEEGFLSYFWIYVIYIVLVALYILVKSFKTYKDIKGENEFFYWKPIKDPKSWWTVARLAFHVFLVAPAARTIELAYLEFKSKSIIKENDMSKMRNHFEQLKSRQRELAFLQHRENSFESGPQLWFKMHLLSLHLLSGKDLGSYDILSLFFIVAGIGSCSWKVVSNRRSVNLSDDFEKRMNWTSHIQTLLLAHALSVWVRFSLLAMFSASITVMQSTWIGISFCASHFFLVLIIVSAMKNERFGSFYNVSENTIEHYFHILDVLLSSLFSFVDFDVKKYRKLRIIIYYVVPAYENLMLIIWACYSGMTMIHALIVAVCLILSWILLYICEKFQLRIATVPSPSSSLLAIDDGNLNVMMGPAKSSTFNMCQSTSNSTARGECNDDNSVHEHFKTLLVYLCLSFSVRIILLGVLMVSSPRSFAIFCGFHMFLIFIAVKWIMYRVQQDEIDWMKIVAQFVKVTDHFGHMKDHTFLFYFAIPFLENIMLIINMCCWTTERSVAVLHILQVLVIGAYIISCILFYWCNHYSLFSSVIDDTSTDDHLLRNPSYSSPRPTQSWSSLFFQTLLCTDVLCFKTAGLQRYRYNCRRLALVLWHQSSTGKIDDMAELPAFGLNKKEPEKEKCHNSTDLIPSYYITAEQDHLPMECTTLRHRSKVIIGNTDQMLPKINDTQKAEFRKRLNEVFRFANLSFMGSNNKDASLNFFLQNVIAITANMLIESSKHLLKDDDSVKCEIHKMIQVTQLLMSINGIHNDNRIASQVEILIEEDQDDEKNIPAKFQGNERNKIPDDAMQNFAEIVYDAFKRKDLIWFCINYDEEDLPEIAIELIKNGADVNAVDFTGRTPLLALCQNYNRDDLNELVRLLILEGANVNAEDLNGKTPLLELIENYGDDELIEMIELFVENGADVNAADSNGLTPLLKLCEWHGGRNLIDIVSLLIENGANVNAKDSKGKTPLLNLCKNYDAKNLKKIVQLLIEYGVDVNTKDLKGRTPLLELCRNYDRQNLGEIVQLLVENGADVNAKDLKGRTPLLELCCNYKRDNLKEIVQLFIAKRVDVNATDKVGRTPLLQLCRNQRHTENVIEVIRLLMDSDGIPEDDPIGSQVKKLIEEDQGDTKKNLWQKLHHIYRDWSR